MKAFKIGFIILLLLLITACGQDDSSDNSETQEQETFKIGAIPDQDAAELSRSMDGIADYIAEETGLKVEYVPSVDYSALVTAFDRGEIQLAWFGGLTGVQARNLVPEAEAIAQRPRDEEFTSVFIAQSDAGIESLEDLEGASFTFGSESSTSGHLMPRHFLMEAGITPEEDFDGVPNYSGSHDKTYKLVESGAFTAGVLSEAVWESAVSDEKVDPSKVKAFYTTPEYYDYNWTINTVDDTFGDGTKDKVKEAILNMGSGQADYLDLFQTDSFIETQNDNYKDIEEVAKQLGIIK
ncbi:putative selenate ABC transporter substrate-binding protein [Cytobacillus gottheilii]|uniref:Selenate ABC transporter substrate-binding protein n=1 Tax=Cytobacillus gottheilii TaxID=859144 RepID=A0ABX8FEV8_9BACI|nr:putative selenate ABC transporter substrate-binding protein [Cytobacillus gottheilii]QVY62561.1 putative selenate ABC transporter substrate-binding protein [Cytobacillus gottheilii]